MRLIGSLPEEHAARLFGDYLLTLGIRHSVDQARDGWAIWIEDEDHLDRARAEFDAFARNPADPKYRNAALEASAIRSRNARREKRLRQNYVDVRTSWARGVQNANPLTLTLALICIAVSLGIWIRQDLALWQYLWFAPINLPGDAPLAYKFEAIASFQLWRFITPIFIHGGVLHLLFNVYWLVDLGGLIEQRKGMRALLILILAAAILSNLGQYLWAGPAFGGMSGVVYALFGYAWMKSRYQPHEQLFLHENTVTIMLLWLVVCMTGLVGSIANTAHVVGLLVGIAFGSAPYWWRRFKRSF